jgi:RNA polymerase sigma-B factor
MPPRSIRFICSMPTTNPRPRAQSVPEVLRQRNRRVDEYRAMVRPIALHYAGLCREQSEDLEQVGLLGLIRAAELYQINRAIPFEAFARPHIRGAILHYLRDCAPTLRLPRRQHELADRVRSASRRLIKSLGRPPSDLELQLDLGLSPLQWQRFEQLRLLAQVGSLDQDPAIAAQPDPSLEAEGEPAALRALEILEPRQLRVVRAVVLQGASLRQVAQELGVSPMTAHRLLRRGLDHLRNLLGEAPSDLTRGPSAAQAC